MCFVNPIALAHETLNLSQGVEFTVIHIFYYYPTISQKVKFQELAKLSPSPQGREDDFKFKQEIRILGIM